MCFALAAARNMLSGLCPRHQAVMGFVLGLVQRHLVTPPTDQEEFVKTLASSSLGEAVGTGRRGPPSFSQGHLVGAFPAGVP